MKRNATAVWKGSVKEGSGTLSTQSTVLNDTQYSFNSRFESGVGTNPEELVAAAHAGCFSMQLSAFLGEAGHEVRSIETQCVIDFQNGNIISSRLTVKAEIPGISNEDFQAQVTRAEENCPISKLLNTDISSEATLL